MSILTNATLSEDGYCLNTFNEKTFIIPIPKSWSNDIILSENGKRMNQNFLNRAIFLVEAITSHVVITLALIYLKETTVAQKDFQYGQ